MDHCVFIQTNHKQITGAIVATHALRRYSQHNDKFDIKIMDTRDYPYFAAREGQMYLRDTLQRVWLNDDLQSFTPTRFMPPELMGYKGRAVVIDPDVFACVDIWDLLNMDMQDKAVMCRKRSGAKGLVDKAWATSAMLLDCEKLKHWQVEKQFNAMFDDNYDYMRWVSLHNEAPETIGLIDPHWNDFDKLSLDTKMLHTTRRKTQPWKSGLPVDWRPAEKFRLFPPLAWLMRARRKFFGEYAFLGDYKDHPDKNQENFFFGLVKECLENGMITEEFLKEEMAQNHVRHDAFEIVAKVPDLPPAPAHPLTKAMSRAA